MACRDAYIFGARMMSQAMGENKEDISRVTVEPTVSRLIFGVDSRVEANDILQNNLTLFEWARRNKLYPSFWGRNIVGENRLTKEEIDFLHGKACRIAPVYSSSELKITEDQGKAVGKEIIDVARELGIPKGTAIFLEIAENEDAFRDYMLGFAETLIEEGYTPAFKANTDAKFSFDREYSRGMQTHRDIFEQCLVWAVAPSLEEYERITTTHLIHPDNWVPFAPSGITRNDIAVWQYGKSCHPINDDAGKETTFNINLIRNNMVIIGKMF